MPEYVSSTIAHIRNELHKVIVGQDEPIEQILVALLAEGHALIEGVPGTAKTLTVKTLSRILNAGFGRIQFTPDLMPSDITGTNVFNMASSSFSLRRGPVFTDLLLADEINRTPPKTQAALLEAMEERQVTIDGEAYALSPLFTVLATENPIEMEGTYPLPEAQLDRFLLKVLVANPRAAEIEAILDRAAGEALPAVTPVLDGPRVLSMQALVRRAALGDRVRAWIARLVEATRPDGPGPSPLVKRFVRYGASARGALALALSGKVLALSAGRPQVAREDVRAVAHAALRHRIVLNFEGEAEGITPDAVLDEVLSHVGPG